MEQVPDQKIGWRATSGNGPNGMVTFESLGPDTTLITVEMSYESEGLVEQLGAKVGMDSRQVGEDLKRFKQLVETTGRRDGRLARRGARGRANELGSRVPRGPMVRAGPLSVRTSARALRRGAP